MSHYFFTDSRSRFLQMLWGISVLGNFIGSKGMVLFQGFRSAASVLGVIRSFSEKLFFFSLLDDYFHLFVNLLFVLFCFYFHTSMWLFLTLSILFTILHAFCSFCYLLAFSELHLNCSQKRLCLFTYCTIICSRLLLLQGLDVRRRFDLVALLTFFQSSMSATLILRQLLTS